MLVSRVEAVDDDAVVVLAFGVDVFVIVEGEGDMGDGLAAKENQVAFLHLRSGNGMGEEIVLLVCVAGQKVAAHAVAELHEATAIQALPAGAAPEVGDAEELPRIARHYARRLARVDALAQFGWAQRQVGPL